MVYPRKKPEQDLEVRHSPASEPLEGTELEVTGPVQVTAVFDIELIEGEGTFQGILDGPSASEIGTALATARLSTPRERVTIAQTWIVKRDHRLALRVGVKGSGVYKLHARNTGYTVVPIS